MPVPTGRAPDRVDDGIVPARRVLAVIVLSLGLAGLFNSAAVVRATDGMPEGATRTALRAVARPVDAVARFLRLDRPRTWVDSALGREEQPVGLPPLSRVPPPSAVSEEPHGSDTGPTRRPQPPVAPRRLSRAAPLRLFVTGDSLPEFLGPQLAERTGRDGRVRTEVDIRYGTGLTRPDFFDWSVNAQQQMARHDPEAVVVMMGGNDAQHIRVPGRGLLREGLPEWGAEYARRAAEVMSVLAAGGRRRVYWVGMPVARDGRVSRDFLVIDAAVRSAAARVPGVHFLDVRALLARDGRYSDYLSDRRGRPVLVRARDGIHLTPAGSALVAEKVLAALDSDWRLTAGG